MLARAPIALAICAIRHGDWADTFQRAHPGVTTMWAGTLAFLVQAPAYAEDCAQIDRSELEPLLRDLLVRASWPGPLILLRTSRLFLVLLNVGALAVAFLYARRLLGPLPALLGFLLIAFDPFYLAHSRLLHLDGLLSSMMLLTMLAFGGHLQRRRTLDLVVSGVAAGLSFLTKSPAMLLAPLAGLAAVVYGWRTRQWSPLLAVVAWGALAAATVVALWPATWVAPYDTIARVLDMASKYAIAGHANSVFFAGTLYANGVLRTPLFYPVTYLWRSTPGTLLGLLVTGCIFVFWRNLVSRLSARWTLTGLGLFVLAYTAALCCSAKKFDRYLLPVYAPLDLVAAVGWVALLRRLGRQRASRLWRSVLPVGLATIAAAQMIGVLRTAPYYLSYYSPLMGGGRRAPQVMMIGWGEGLDQAARYLNQKPDAEQLHVVSWYAPGCFSYFFEGQSKDILVGHFADIDLQEALNADYVVTYDTHQAQRQEPAPLLSYLDSREPEYTVQIDGISYASVYSMSTDIRDEPSYRQVDVVLEDLVSLEGYSVSPANPTAGQTLVVSLAWQALDAPHERLKVFVHLLDDDGRLVAQHDGEPLAWHSPTDRWEAGNRLTDRHGLVLPFDLPPGEYVLQVGMYRYSGDRLDVAGAGSPTQDAIELNRLVVRPVTLPDDSPAVHSSP